MLKLVPIKMDEKEYRLFKEARAYAIMEGKRIGTWVSEAIKDKLEKVEEEKENA